jgi:transcription initiation factor TFIID TATA-box-binding protein
MQEVEEIIDEDQQLCKADQEQTTAEQQSAVDDADQEPEPEIDIVINNVVCSFSVRCHLNLREIALNGFNVEFRRENGMVTMKLRRPYTTASIWSSGRITCTGATSEDQVRA